MMFLTPLWCCNDPYPIQQSTLTLTILTEHTHVSCVLRTFQLYKLHIFLDLQRFFPHQLYCYIYLIYIKYTYSIFVFIIEPTVVIMHML